MYLINSSRQMVHDKQRPEKIFPRIFIFDCVFFDFRTALHYCVEHSSPNCIRLLINFGGANPNIADSSSLTPLHYCAMYNCEESLQELLDVHDLKVNVVDKNKRLPLHYAAASGNITILSTLADVKYFD